MKTIINKNIIFISLIYSFALFSNDNKVHCCHCNHSGVVQYMIDIKDNITNKVNSIPKNTKKLVATSVVKVEEMYDGTKKSINNGFDYVKNFIISIIDWAHNIKDME